MLMLLLLVVFATLALAELLWATRDDQDVSDRRLALNFSLGLVNLLLGTIAPIGAVATGFVAEQQGWGLLQLRSMPLALDILAIYTAQSLTGYWLHRLSHRVPLLWYFHRLHHTDRAIDVSTALRNHPVELIPALVASTAPILVLSPSLDAVAVAATILFAQGLCTHTNVRLPASVARRLEWIVVTPNAHLVHHSADRPATDSNFSDSLPWWDRLFGTWRGAEPVSRIGVDVASRQPSRIRRNRSVTLTDHE